MAKNRDSGVSNRAAGSTEDLFAKWVEEEEQEEREQQKRLRERRNAEIEGAQTVDELKDFMGKNYFVEVSDDFNRYDLDAAKAYIQEASEMLDEFPILRSAITRFGDNINRKGVFGAASSSGNVSFNIESMQSLKKADAMFKRNVKSGLHPEGTSAVNAVSHELGHMLELAIIKKTYGERSKEVAWLSHTVGKDIVASAMSRLPSSSGKESGKPISDISRYATHDASETVAEAVADYRANGERAKPLSREIWRELKKRLT